MEPAPVQRIAPATERHGELSSLVVFFLAAIAAVAVVFVSSIRDSGSAQPAFVSTSSAPMATDTRPAAVAPESSRAPIAVADVERTPLVRESTSPTTSRTVPPPERTQTEQSVAATSEPAELGNTNSVAPAVATLADAAFASSAAQLGPSDQIRDYIGLAADQPLPPMFVYTIQEGDTLASVAGRFGLDEATIHFNNFDLYDPNLLVPGEVLRLPTLDGVIYTVQPGDNLSVVAANYAADVDATVAYPGNRLASSDQIFANQTLVLVGGSASIPVAQQGSGGGSQAVAAAWTMPRFGWPLAFDEITDYFGTPRNNRAGYHTGVDFSAPTGTIVGATAGGQVSFAGWDGSYGYWVEVDHGGGVRSRYAHLSEIWVATGQWRR